MVSSSEEDGKSPFLTKDNKMPLSQPSGTADRPTVTTSGVSDRLQTTSESSADTTTGWLRGLESLIERYPWPTLLLALSLGYMISRRLR